MLYRWKTAEDVESDLQMSTGPKKIETDDASKTYNGPANIDLIKESYMVRF